MNLLIKPFVPNAPFLYSLRTSENLTVFLHFHGIKKRNLVLKWAKMMLILFKHFCRIVEDFRPRTQRQPNQGDILAMLCRYKE